MITEEKLVENTKIEVTAKMVADLRKSTSSSMMDCKRALQECNCDMIEAIGWLRRNSRPRNGAMISYNWKYINEKAIELKNKIAAEEFIYNEAMKNCDVHYFERDNEQYKNKIDELYKELRSLPTHQWDGLE